MGKRLRILLIFIVFFICTAGYSAYKIQRKTITIFHTSDNHVRGPADQNISYARLAGYVETYRRKHPDTLLLDAGDALQGLSLSDVSQGHNALEVMNMMNFNAMVPGNHEFDWGAENLLSLAQEAEFPLVAVNFIKSRDEAPMLPMYILEEIKDISIAVIGVITPDMHELAVPKNIAGYKFPDPTPLLQALVPELKKEFDVVIVLAHMGLEGKHTSTRLAEDVPDIDIIIDGHDHIPLPEGLTVGNTLIANAGEYGEYLGEIKLTVKGGKIFRKKASLIKAETINKTPPKQEIVKLITEQKEKFAKELAEKRGSLVTVLPVTLIGKRTAVRAGQTNLTTLLTDALLEETGADAVLISSGGIRQNLSSGEIMEEDIYNVMPFGDIIVSIGLSGEELRRALEHGLNAYPDLVGRFPQVAGMTVFADYQKPAGNRVQRIIIQGKELDPQAIYRIATSAYLAGGGDGYTQFKGKPILANHGLQKDIFTRMLVKCVENNKWPEESSRIISQ